MTKPAAASDAELPLTVVIAEERGAATLRSPLMSKLYQESNLRLGANRIAMHPDAAREARRGRRRARNSADPLRKGGGGSGHRLRPAAGDRAGRRTAGDLRCVRHLGARKGGARMKRYGMTIDVDRCNGCGACMVACAVENNVPPGQRGRERAQRASRRSACSRSTTARRIRTSASAFIPMMCQQCGERHAVRARVPAAGGGSRSRDRHRGPDGRALPGLPLLHGGLPVSRALLQLVGPGVARGHGEDAESGRRAAACAAWSRSAISATAGWHAAQEQAAAAGKQEIDPADYLPACVEACPTGAIRFGDLDDPAESRGAAAGQLPAAASGCGTEPKIYYRSKRTGCGAAQRTGPEWQGAHPWISTSSRAA